MTEPRVFRFEDLDSGDEALVVVRRAGDVVGLAVSLEHGADVEVYAPPEVLLQVAEAIKELIEAP